MSETLARESDINSISNWNVGTLRDYLLGLIGANDRRYSDESKSVRDLITAADLRYGQRFLAQENAMAAAFAAQERAIAAALSAAKEAVTKAEIATEKRLENTNEWRASINDRDRLLMPRKETENAMSSLKEQIEILNLAYREQRSNSSGVSAGWGMAVGVVALIGIVISIVGFVLRMPK